jgi:hypothetical protein
MVVKIQLRRGTSSDWSTANTVLAQGEMGVETDTLKVKVGDGSTAWNSLGYFNIVLGSSSPSNLASSASAGTSSTGSHSDHVHSYSGILDSSTTLASGVTNSSLVKIGSLSSGTAGFVKIDSSGNLTSDSSTYLTTSSAASTYLTISNAASNYLTISSATSTYLPITTASSTYLTQTNAASTYLTQTNATSTYLTQTNATSTYAPINSPTFTGIVTVPTPSNATDAVTKQYVDNIASGINAHDAVVAASTAPLTVTYNNNTTGVGATLTNAGTQAAFSIDNVTLAQYDRILVKNQTDSTQNGIYTLTTVGSGSSNWVLTRASDYDQSTPGEVAAGDMVFVLAPASKFSITPINQNTSWIMNSAGTITIGSSYITFSQSSGSGTVTAGTGISVTANQVSNTGVLSVNGSTGAITNIATTSQTFYIGTTSIAINRSSGSQTLNGISIDGNAGTVTNGVYTTDTGTVTNTMLAGSISNSKLSNSSISINGSAISLGGSISGLATSASPTFTGTVTFPLTTAGYVKTTSSGVISSSSSVPWADISSTPTTLSGYGISNGATSGANSNITSLTGLTTPLSTSQGGTGTSTALTPAGVAFGDSAGKHTSTPAGTAGQFLMSYGDIANGGPEWISLPIVEEVMAATNGPLTGTWVYANNTPGTTASTLTYTGTSYVLDGYTFVAGDRVLVKDQTSSSTPTYIANGVYIISSIGASTIVLTRDNDADTIGKLGGSIVTVNQGTVNGGTIWQCTNSATTTMGSSAVNFNNVVTSLGGSGIAGQILMSYGGYGLNAPEWVSIAAMESVSVATTTALTGTYNNNTPGTVASTFTITATGPLIVDGYTLNAGERLLIKNQTAGTTPTNIANGIYIVTTAGATGVSAVLTRDNDSDTMGKVSAMPISVDQGTLNGATQWFNTNKTTDTMGTTAINYYNTTGNQLNNQPSSYYADHIIPYTKTGVLTTSTGTIRYRLPWAATIIATTAAVNTAPTGAAIIVDVLKNGTTIYSTTANRPTIAISTFATTTSPTPDVTTLAAGDYLTVNISQVGSTVAGSDLSVFVELQRA